MISQLPRRSRFETTWTLENPDENGPFISAVHVAARATSARNGCAAREAVIPCDGTGDDDSDLPLEKLNRVIALSAAPDRLRQGRIHTRDVRWCISGATTTTIELPAMLQVPHKAIVSRGVV